MRLTNSIYYLVLLGGCAGVDEVAKQPVDATVESTLAAKVVASCIDRNADNLDAMRSKIRELGTDKYEVLIVSVAQPGFVGAIVTVQSTANGSQLQFRFGSPYAIAERRTPGVYIDKLTANCRWVPSALGKP